MNKNLDYVTFNNFFNLKVGGVDFGAGIKKNHPEIDQGNYKEYINDLYKNNERILGDSLVELNKEIENRESAFFDSLEKLLGVDYKDREYKGAISIFNCNPRYLDEHVFQVYYKKDLLDKIEVVFHEVLHFVFFDYCDEFLPEVVYGLDKNQGPYWKLSEIFNVLILNRPEFQKIIERPEYMFYPELQGLLPKIKEIWERSEWDMKNFVRESLKEI